MFALGLLAGTNRYAMKLGLFITVGSDLRTKIIGFTLLKQEGAEDVKWAFQSFLKAFKLPPTVIFTDSDFSIKPPPLFFLLRITFCARTISRRTFLAISMGCLVHEASGKNSTVRGGGFA
jgi:hypothetical protein